MIIVYIFVRNTSTRYCIMFKYSDFRLLFVGIFLLIVLSGCNSDIFVDRIDAVGQSIAIEGDGGHYTVKIQTKGLEWIDLVTSGYNDQVTYYTHDGEIAPSDAPFEDIALINYTNDWMIFDIVITDDLLTFTSTEQAYDKPWDVLVYLNYGHTSVDYNITVLPGRQAEVTSVSYAMENMTVQNNADVAVWRTHYYNNSPSELKVMAMPYSGAQVSALLEDPGIYYAFPPTVSIPLPEFCDGEWLIGDELHTLTLGSTLRYAPEQLADVSVPVSVQPYSKVEVACQVSYSSVKVPVFIHLLNPVSGRTRLCLFMCGVLAPVSYELKIENE